MSITIRPYRDADYPRLRAIHDAARQNELALAGLSDAFLPLEVYLHQFQRGVRRQAPPADQAPGTVSQHILQFIPVHLVGYLSPLIIERGQLVLHVLLQHRSGH